MERFFWSRKKRWAKHLVVVIGLVLIVSLLLLPSLEAYVVTAAVLAFDLLREWQIWKKQGGGDRKH